MFAAEEAHVSNAVPRRRAEFSTGRWCARQALAVIGAVAAEIPVGPRREPVWPAGTTGSITHAAEIVAAVAIGAQQGEGIGIDLVEIEQARELLRSADAVIGSAEEHVAAAANAAGIGASTLLFSTKESAIKAFSLRAQKFVDFTEIQVAIRGFEFKAFFGGSAHVARGWWKPCGPLLVTAAVTEPRVTEPRP